MAQQIGACREILTKCVGKNEHLISLICENKVGFHFRSQLLVDPIGSCTNLKNQLKHNPEFQESTK